MILLAVCLRRSECMDYGVQLQNKRTLPDYFFCVRYHLLLMVMVLSTNAYFMNLRLT